MKSAVVFLAEGFEECEGLIVVDLLRRAGVQVTMASISSSCQVVGSHGIVVQADMLADEVDYNQADMIILPGGVRGTANLSDSGIVKEQCLSFAEQHKYVAAICAAPSILGALGLLDGKPATCHPNYEEKLMGASVTGDSVTTAGRIITGQGLGAAIPFALELVKILVDQETADRIGNAICFRS